MAAADLAACPWAEGHVLARVRLRAEDVAAEARGPVNLVFLVDVSGSMSSPGKLDRLRRTLPMLVGQLRAGDTASVVTYAGGSRVVLPPTDGSDHTAILAAIDGLRAGGSTNGSAGIRDAYALARRGNTDAARRRVVLLTDGDFNVGVTDPADLVALARAEAEGGVGLTVIGVGTGNLNDALMETLSNRADGSYAYLDSDAEAERVMGGALTGLMWTAARDVKLQVEFNPEHVAAYRLIGYDNRRLADADFADDRRDAGEVGAGQAVTALYELVPAGSAGAAEPLAFQEARAPTGSDDWLELRLRFKRPGSDQSERRSVRAGGPAVAFEAADADLRFAAAVAAWGMLLSGSDHAGDATPAWIEHTARAAATDADRRAFADLAARSANVVASN